uniref:hypothetical protein n=1 Tax=Roseivirga sp. TaxID=1964215 RepID=UPI004047A929
MKSLKHLQNISAGQSFISDDFIEFHASRIILLIAICGTKNTANKLIRIEGLTKLAKLDFFVRYPEFFERAAAHLKEQVQINDTQVESKMIRFHYGPWDDRYYQVLPFLEARGLIDIRKTGKSYEFYLTEKGIDISESFKINDQFQNLISSMKEVKKVLGKMNGSKIKDLVYELFTEEVGEKKLKETINQ